MATAALAAASAIFFPLIVRIFLYSDESSQVGKARYAEDRTEFEELFVLRTDTDDGSYSRSESTSHPDRRIFYCYAAGRICFQQFRCLEIRVWRWFVEVNVIS